MLNKDLASYLMAQFENLEGVTSRPMMGGYVFYYNGKIFGGIYEPGFMVKVTKTSKKYLPLSKILPPYNGAKDMILVADIDNRKLLCDLVVSMYDELPTKK